MGEGYGFIVEGDHDKYKLKSILPKALFVVTRGLRYNDKISDNILGMILESKKVYILTDPDSAGDQIAEKVWEDFPNLRRIKLEREHCKYIKGKRVKIGVEHATDEYLKREIGRYMER